MAILKVSPEVGEWWAAQEESISREKGKTNQFRPGEPTVRELIDMARNDTQMALFARDEQAEALADCFCGDGA